MMPVLTKILSSFLKRRLVSSYGAASVLPAAAAVMCDENTTKKKRCLPAATMAHLRDKTTAGPVPGGDYASTINNSKSSSSGGGCGGGGVIDVSDLAESMRQEVRSYTGRFHLASRGLEGEPPPPVRLVGVLAESSPYKLEAELYSERLEETCAEDGIQYEVCRCTGNQPSDVEAAIRQVNERSDVHGILVFYPIFKNKTSLLQCQHQKKKGPYLNKLTGTYYKTQDDYLRDVVIASKDVEGLSHNFHTHRRLFRARNNRVPGNEVYIPCTALAVRKILETYHLGRATNTGSTKHQRLSGLTATIINRSEILGRPLAALLALDGATVYSVDENSILMFTEGGRRLRRCSNEVTLEQCLEQSSVVVTGVPSPSFVLPSEFIAPGTTVVDVSESSNVDEETLLARPNVRLIPSVGKVTCAALELNLIRLHQNAICK